MKKYRIYWTDLTEEAQERLKDLNTDTIKLFPETSPLTVIKIEEDETEPEEYTPEIEGSKRSYRELKKECNEEL